MRIHRWLVMILNSLNLVKCISLILVWSGLLESLSNSLGHSNLGVGVGLDISEQLDCWRT